MAVFQNHAKREWDELRHLSICHPQLGLKKKKKTRRSDVFCHPA